MKRTYQEERKELTDYDLFLTRNFLEEGLKKYASVMRDFWAHAESYKGAGPGEHAFPDPALAASCGYFVAGRNAHKGLARGVAAWPFVRAKSLAVLPSGADSRQALQLALDEPLMIEEFYCVLESRQRVAFLTREAYAASVSMRSLEASVILGREEAYAILSGRLLDKTKRKLIAAFNMEEGEWV